METKCLICGDSDLLDESRPLCIVCAYSVNESIGVYPAEMKRIAEKIVEAVEYDPAFDESLYQDYGAWDLSDEQLRPLW